MANHCIEACCGSCGTVFCMRGCCRYARDDNEAQRIQDALADKRKKPYHYENERCVECLNFTVYEY